MFLVFPEKEAVLRTKMFINFLLNLKFCIDKEKKECYIYVHKLLALNKIEC